MRDLLRFSSSILLLLAFSSATVAQDTDDPRFNPTNFPSIKYPEDYCDSIDASDEWDFIIVGAGSAGSVLARRLSEVPEWRILLVEAGGDPPDLWTAALGTFLPVPELEKHNEWGFGTIAKDDLCQGFINGSCPLRRAKVLGGCSSNNYMQYVRGSFADYDHWSSLGNKGWSYLDVLPYFKKSEDFEALKIESQQTEESVSSKYHAKGGPLKVNIFAKDPETEYIRASIEQAYQSVGFEKNSDFNGERQVGYGKIQATADSKEFRMSAARAFLQSPPENLKVCKYSTVDKLIIEGRVATGIEFSYKGSPKKAYAKKEVILSAGSIGSPGILERSGIGDMDILAALDIPVIVDLPGVGENVQDHIMSISPTYAIDHYLKREPIMIAETLGDFDIFFNTEDHTSNLATAQLLPILADAAHFFTRMDIAADIIGPLVAQAAKRSTISLVATVVETDSRGRIHILDKDPNSKPFIDINSLSTLHDRQIMRQAMRVMDEIFASEPMKKLNPELLPISRCVADGVEPKSDEYYECIMRTLCTSMFHPVGSCAMGPSSDLYAVVGNDLLVHGFKNLRVVDGSIMPKIPRGNTNAPIMMIGERAADFIKEKHLQIGDGTCVRTDGNTCEQGESTKNLWTEAPSE